MSNILCVYVRKQDKQEKAPIYFMFVIEQNLDSRFYSYSIKTR
jgi:hypothetical protein